MLFMDIFHYHVRNEGRIVKRAVYIALGTDMNAKKDVLGADPFSVRNLFWETPSWHGSVTGKVPSVFH